MKIVYVTNDVFGQGGVARVLSIKSSFLIEKPNYQVEIISSTIAELTFFKFSPSVLIKHIPIYGRSAFSLLSYFRRLKKEIIKAKPDCVVICDNGIKGHLMCFLDFKAPVVFESHAIDLIPLSKGTFLIKSVAHYLKKILIRMSLKRVSKHVVLSQSAADLLKSKNAIVIPNPIGLSAKPKANLNSQKAIAVGRLTPSKGYERMLRIWKKIHQIHPDWKLDIYGEGSYKNQLLELIESYNLSDIVNLKGSTPKIENLYKDYALLIHTSLYESFSMVLLEAMVNGLPVVAYDCPLGPREIVTNEEDGFLVEDNAEEAFVERATSLMSDHMLRSHMGQNASVNMKRFETKEMMRQWQQLFVDLKKDYDSMK